LSKVKVVHLHNNYGEKDTHNLLFDGTVNWDILKKIIDNPEVTFVLEIKNNHKADEEVFLKQAKNEFSKLMKTLK
jgi:sugar phosphate isomerase/epimerase